MNRRTFRQKLADRLDDGRTSALSSIGGAAGVSIVDNTLVNYQNDDLKGAEITLTSGTYDGVTREVTGFTASSGTCTVSPAFAAQIASAVTYEMRTAWRKRHYDQALADAERHAALVRRSLRPWRDESIVLNPYLTEYMLPYGKRTTGTADAGSTVTSLKDSGLTEPEGFWKGATLVCTGGTNVGEVREVSDFDAANNVAITSRGYASAIDNTTTFAIIKHAPAYLHAAEYYHDVGDWRRFQKHQWEILQGQQPMLRILPQYLPKTGLLLSNCDTPSDWVVSGSVASTPTLDDAFRVEGDGSISLGTESTGTAIWIRTNSYDLSEYQYFQFLLYLKPGALTYLDPTNAVRVEFFSGATSYYRTTFALTELLEGQWSPLGRPFKNMTSSGSPSWATITSIRLSVVVGTLAITLGDIKMDAWTAHHVPPILRLHGMRLPEVTQVDMEELDVDPEYAMLWAESELWSMQGQRRDLDAEDAQARHLAKRQEAELALQQDSSRVPPDSKRVA